MTKLIYLKTSPEKYERDTWVELIGEGHYAINQTGWGSDKGKTNLVYLTRQQIEEILKEQEVKLLEAENVILKEEAYQWKIC